MGAVGESARAPDANDGDLASDDVSLSAATDDSGRATAMAVETGVDHPRGPTPRILHVGVAATRPKGDADSGVSGASPIPRPPAPASVLSRRLAALPPGAMTDGSLLEAP